jgi:hypothetical protein
LVAYQLLQHILKAMGTSMRDEHPDSPSLEINQGELFPNGFAG